MFKMNSVDVAHSMVAGLTQSLNTLPADTVTVMSDEYRRRKKKHSAASSKFHEDSQDQDVESVISRKVKRTKAKKLKRFYDSAENCKSSGSYATTVHHSEGERKKKYKVLREHEGSSGVDKPSAGSKAARLGDGEVKKPKIARKQVKGCRSLSRISVNRSMNRRSNASSDFVDKPTKKLSSPKKINLHNDTEMFPRKITSPGRNLDLKRNLVHASAYQTPYSRNVNQEIPREALVRNRTFYYDQDAKTEDAENPEAFISKQNVGQNDFVVQNDYVCPNQNIAAFNESLNQQTTHFGGMPVKYASSYPRYTNNYLMPTIASRMKWVPRNYLRHHDDYRVPFVVGTSVNTTNNLRLLKQETTSKIKTFLLSTIHYTQLNGLNVHNLRLLIQNIEKFGTKTRRPSSDHYRCNPERPCTEQYTAQSPEIANCEQLEHTEEARLEQREDDNGMPQPQ